MDYQTTGDIFQLKNNVNIISNEFSSNIHCSSTDHSISKLTDLSLDIIREIFDYLSLGDIYHSFYYINNIFKNFIDNSFSCLNLMSMSYNHFIFYYKYISFNNCQKINSLILLNEKPFNQIERFISIIYLYINLKKLHLYSPNINQLEILSLIIPNLCELFIIFKNEKSINIKYLSLFKKLQICSIDSKIYGIEIDQSMHSLSSLLTSLTITLSSTYDFYTLLSRLSINTLCYLNISLLDNEFSYIKTFRSPISLAKNLINFSFNMSLKAMKDASCLYDIIRFISNTLHYIKTLTILCRLTDGILIDENKLRNYLSFIYSVNKYKLFIEMNNNLIFDELLYTYPFWIDKNIHINIYRNKNNQIKRVHTYTLSLIKKIPNYFQDMYKLIKSSSSSSNIHQFISNDLHDHDDLTLISNRIHSSSNISLLFYLPRLSSFEVIENEMLSFLKIFSQSKIFPNIRKLQFDHLPNLLMENTEEIFHIFPCLQSLSIGKVNDFDIFGNILNKFLIVLPNKQALIHLCITGLYFDDICPEYLDEEQLKMNLEEIFISLCKRKNSYDISFNRYNRSIDIWL